MARKIVWTRTANIKFNNIIAYLEEEWGEQLTESFFRKTYDIIELISEQSDLGTLENLVENIRGFLLTKHNRLFCKSRSTHCERTRVESLLSVGRYIE